MWLACAAFVTGAFVLPTWVTPTVVVGLCLILAVRDWRRGGE